MTPCAWTTSGASTSSGIATGRALGPSMALRVHAHRLMDSSVRRPTAPTVLFRVVTAGPPGLLLDLAHRWHRAAASSQRAARAPHGEPCPADRWLTKPDTERQVLAAERIGAAVGVRCWSRDGRAMARGCPGPRPSAGHSCRVPPIWHAHVGGRCDTVDKSWPPPSARGHGGMPRIPG
jgi:hypothetical protein